VRKKEITARKRRGHRRGSKGSPARRKLQPTSEGAKKKKGERIGNLAHDCAYRVRSLCRALEKREVGKVHTKRLARSMYRLEKKKDDAWGRIIPGAEANQVRWGGNEEGLRCNGVR